MSIFRAEVLEIGISRKCVYVHTSLTAVDPGLLIHIEVSGVTVNKRAEYDTVE